MDLAGMKRRELQALCKRHGLPAGGTNADLVARLDAALSGPAGAEEEVVARAAARKGCLKQTSGDAAGAKKVTFGAEEGKARRLRSRVVWSPIVAKTRGKSAQATSDSAAAAAAAEDSVSAEAGKNVPVRRSRRNSVSAAEAEEIGEVVAIGSKRKRKNQENDEGVAVSAHVGVSSRVTRRSSLAGAAVVLPPAVEKKRGRGNTAGGSKKPGSEAPDVQDSAQVEISAQIGVSTRVTRRSSLAGAAVVLPPAVDKKRGRGKTAAGSNKPVAEASDVQDSAQVEISARITKSRATAPVVMSPMVVENKRRKTIDARTDVPTVPDVPKNDAPATRSLRSRAVQVNNSIVDETHTVSQLENKTQPSKQPTRRHQQVSSSVEDNNPEQIAAPSKAPLLRRSGRNYSEDVKKQPAVKEPVKRSTRKSSVLATVEKEENDLFEEKNPAAHVRRSTRKSIVPVKDIKGIAEKVQNANGEDVTKKPATKGLVRGSRRKSVVSELHEKEKGLIAEKGRSMRKSVMLVEDTKAVGERIQNATSKDVEKQVVVKQPTRRSSRKSAVPAMLENNSGLLAAEMNAQMNIRRSTRKSVVPNMLNEENQDHNKMSRKRRRTNASDEEMSVKAKDDMRDAKKDSHKATHEYNKESSSKVPEIYHVDATRQEFYSGPLLATVALTDEICTAQSVPVVIHGSESGDNANGSTDKSKQPQQHSATQAVDSHLSETRSGKLDQSTFIAGPVPHNCVVSEDKALMSEDGISIDFTVGYCEKQSPVSGEGRAGLEANASEPGEKNLANVMSTGLHAKSPQHDIDIIAEEADKDVLTTASPIEEHGEQYAVSPVAVVKSVGWEASASESTENPLTGIFSNDLHTKHLQHDCDVLTKETASGAAPPMSESDTNPEIQCNAEESIEAADLGKCPSLGRKGDPCPTSLHLEGAADDCILPVLNGDKGCSSDERPSSFGLDLMFAEACNESYAKNIENTVVEIVGGNQPSTPVTPGFYVGSVCLGDEDVQPSGYDADKNLDVDQGVPGEENTAVEIDCGNKPSTPVAPDFYVGSDCIEDGTEEVLDQQKCNDEHVPAKTNLLMKLSDELGNERFVADNLDQQVVIQVQPDDVQECDLEKPSLCSATRESKHECGLPEEYTSVEIDGGNKPRASLTPGFSVGTECLEFEDVQPTGCDDDKNLDVDHSVSGEDNTDFLEDEDVQPTRCDADKKLDVDQGVIEEEVLAQEKSNDQHVPAKTDLNMKINDELAGPCTESGCSIIEKNARLVADNLDEQAIILVQQGDVREGDLKPSSCSTTPECKQKYGLPEETVLLPKNTGSLLSSEQSPFGLESLFSQEKIDGSMGSATAHTKSGFDDSKDCHVKSAHENTHVSEPYSLDDIVEGSSKNEDCMQTSQQDNGMEGLPEADLDEERGDVEEATPLPERTGGGNKASTPITPDVFVGSNCMEDEDVQPTGFDADKKLDVDQGVAAEELLTQQKSNDQHVPTKTDLNMKLNNELASPYMESGCSITEKNARPFADNLDQQAIFQVQQGDVQEGDLKKPPSCSTTPEGKHKHGLPEETILLPKNTGSLLSSEQSPFGLESLFSQENVDGSMGSATAHTKSGFDDSKDCHVKSAHENTHVSEPYSLNDIVEGSSKNEGCMQTSQQDNGMEEADLDEERVPSVFSNDAKLMKEVINFEEVACEDEGSKTPVHSEELKASSEKTNVNGPDGNAYGIIGAVLSSSLQTLANDNYEICLGSNTDVLHQGHHDQCRDDKEGIIEDSSAKYIERGTVLLSGKERSNLKDGLLNSNLEEAKVVDSGLYFNKDIGNILDSRSVVGEITPSGSGLSKDSSKAYKQEVLDGSSVVKSLDGSSAYGEKNVCRVDAIENPSISLATTGYNHEGALSDEAAHALKNYSGTCSSNPRELLMDLQSLFSKRNIKESNPHVGLAFSGAENSGDESINVEQQVKVHHGSDLSHVESINLLDELIGCSNAEVLHQSHNHEDRSNVDRVEQVAFEPCTNDIVEAAAAAECIESGLVLLPSEERSNLNDGQLNPKLESATSMGSALNIVVGERTPSGSGLQEDYPKDQYPRQELLDGCSVESSQKIVSAVAGTGTPSSSLATPDYKCESALSKEAVSRMKNCTGTSLVDPKNLIMELQSLHSEGSTEKPDPQDNLAFPSAERGRDESVTWHAKKLLDTHVSSEPDTYQRPCKDLSSHEEKESCMKGSLTSVQIDLADDAHLIERDIVGPSEVLCEEKVERTCMPTSDSDIRQEKSNSNGHGIYQSPRQKHIEEANSRLSSCGTGTEVLHQDHKEERNEHNDGKFSPKALVENNMSEDAPVEGMESSIMLPLAAGTSEIPDEHLNTIMSDESEELSLSCDRDTIENFCTGPANGDLNSLPKDFHVDTCQKQEVLEVSLPKSPEESAKFQCVSVSGSGPCQQRVNESTRMQATYNIETVNQDHEEYNQNNEDQTTHGISAISVPEAVEMEIEIEQSEMEIGLTPVTETSVLAIPDEQPNSKLEGSEDQITLGIPASSMLKAADIEQSEMEIGLIPAAETSVLPVPDEQCNSKLESKEVDEHSCSYDKDFFILSDSESLKREASRLHKDDCLALSSEDNHPNDLPAPRSPEPSACFQNDNDLGSVGICQSSRQRGIAELRAKLQNFKVSSTVKGSYIAMSAPHPKPGDSMSQSAIALLRNIENTTAVKTGHPVKPNADGKDSSRRALQPISGRPKEH